MNKSSAYDATPGQGGGTVKKTLINLLVTLVFGLVYFYLELPALNLHDQEFYVFVFLLSAVWCVSSILTSGLWKLQGQGDFFRSVKNNCRLPLIICAALVVIFLLGSLLSSVILRAGSYSKLLSFETGDFSTDVTQVSYDQIPMLDADSASKLADRKLGELSDMVSQFEVSDTNTQINYQDRPVRVAPLVYGDLIKWFNNRSEGLPAYVLIDMVTQNVEVVRLEEGMKYTPAEHFSRNLYRHLRFSYPTYMFDEPTFEIDEEGTPYWICPRLVMTIGLFGGRDIDGAVLVNAITGESTYYDAEDVPSWVDRVYNADLIVEQYDYYGQYHNGFLNSIFGQKGVTVTTDGYNYMAMDDDVYMYTGITSVGGDQSNVGFILTNQRTKQTTYYQVAGATEYSARSSAEGVVQHLAYKSTFPLLLNIGGEPTYFMSLKDNAGLVKMYAMVNVRQYQVVATGSTVAECQAEYEKLLLQNDITEQTPTVTGRVEGVVTEKREAVIGGDTYYYLKLQGQEGYFSLRAADNELAVILNTGDWVEMDAAADQQNSIRSAKLLQYTPSGQPAQPESTPQQTQSDSTQTEAKTGESEPESQSAAQPDASQPQDDQQAQSEET